MPSETFLVYLDMLGFKSLAEEISKIKDLETRRVREDFLKVIKDKIRLVKKANIVSSVHYGDSDNWLFTVDSLEMVFRLIFELLEHNTGYGGYSKIPLEIGVGIGEYDKWANFTGSKLFFEDSTIKTLKNDIIKYYHDFCTEKLLILKNSFILLTESVYEKLEPLEKKRCEKINHNLSNNSILNFYVADIEKFRERGKLFKFLNILKRSGNSIYDRINDIYVPPDVYDDIKETLRIHKIVFITGTAEYGKTYTAIRLLWEYYNLGYTPVWLQGAEPFERMEVRRNLEDIEGQLLPNRVVYFEDPFGKTKYESRENLEREIGTILIKIKNIENAYVVITSREEVFSQFLKEKISTIEISSFEKKLNLKKPSYSKNQMEEILFKWAEAKSCLWFEDATLKRKIIEKMDKEQKLPTPMSIRDFVGATTKILNEYDLAKEMELKSKETAISFAAEIKNMTDDKIIFLSLPMISTFEIEFARAKYNELIASLQIENAANFDNMLTWFKKDKISIRVYKLSEETVRYFSSAVAFEKPKSPIYPNKESSTRPKNESVWEISFSHSSYREALEHLLVDGGKPSLINRKILSKVFLHMVKSSETMGKTASLIAINYEKFPDEVKLALRESLGIAGTEVVEALTGDLIKVNEEGFALLLEILSNRRYHVETGGVIKRLRNMMPTLPLQRRKSLLTILSQRTDNLQDLIEILIYYFEIFSDDEKNLLTVLRDESIIKHVMRFELNYYRDLTQSLRNHLPQLINKPELSEDAAWAVARNYANLPDEIKRAVPHFQETIQRVLTDLCNSEKYGSANACKAIALELITDAQKGISEKFLLSILHDLSTDKNQLIKNKAIDLINQIVRNNKSY